MSLKSSKVKQPQEYLDGRTKQCFRDECDIQKIMARADRVGTISHLKKFEGVYADYADFDFFEQTQKLTRGREIFDELPGELRQEFGQSPAKFFEYVNDPANKEELLKKLPGLAAPGRQLPSTSPATADETAAALAKEVIGPAPTPKEEPIVPPTASQEAEKTSE